MNESRSDGFVAKWKRWRKGSPELLGDLQCESMPRVHPDRRAKYGWEDQPKAPISAQDRRRLRGIYRPLAILACSVIFLFFLATALTLPRVGDADAPAMNEVVDRYLNDNMEETGVVNTVAGVILSYRAFDTLGEAHVLFSALAAVMILLETHAVTKQTRRERVLDRVVWGAQGDPIMQEVTRILFPAVALFGIYVIFNGHLSPGGGFSGGTVFGAGLILHSIAFGDGETRRFFSERIFLIVKVSTLLVYSVVMFAFFVTGANGLPWSFPLGTVGNIFSSGHILLINVAVGFEVACTMYGMYSMFERGHV